MTDLEIKNRRVKVFSDIVGCAFRAYNYFHWGVDELVYAENWMLGADIKDKCIRV